MELNSPQKPSKFSLKFFGQGSIFFGIVALNVLLTVVTLGLYYPWAKAAYRKYLWNETEMKDSRFVFHGTGKEMFKGFVVVYAVVIAFYAIVFFAAESELGPFVILLFYAFLLGVLPYAIFATWKYRVSRTSWRGIHFYFDGNFKEFAKLCYVQLFFTVITLGIYAPWMRVKIEQYMFSHTSLGNLKLDFKGQGADLFIINLVGGILSYITLFLYLPVFIKDRFNFTVDNTTISDGLQEKKLVSTLSGNEAWKTLMLNFVMLVFTLGLAFPWTMMRSMRMYFNNVHIPNDFNFDNLEQSPEDYRNATGDEAADFLDLDLGF